MGKIFRDLVSFQKAKSLTAENVRPVTDFESVNVWESVGRVVTENIYSGVPLPPFSRSEVDGYAVLSDDLSEAGADRHVSLIVKKNAEIGKPPVKHPGHGYCVPIATGAVMPINCDAVTMVEDAVIYGQTAEFSKSVTKWENVAHAGEDMPGGTLIIRKNAVVTPVTVAVLAASGINIISVYRKTRIGVVSSGDELLTPGDPLVEGKLYESNSTYVASELSRFSSISVRKYPLMRDDMDAIRKTLEAMIKENDAVIVSGGTSAGEGDYVYRTLEGMQPGIIYHGVAVKPGTPTVFAVSDSKPVFGLPGFPVSSMMVFRALFMPAIMKIARLTYHETIIRAAIGLKTLIRFGYTNLMILRLVERNGKVIALPVNGASGSVTRLLDAEGYSVILGDRKFLEAGEEIEVHLIRENLSRTFFLGPTDSVTATFLSTLDDLPAIIRVSDDAVLTMVSQVSPDFAVISALDGNDFPSVDGYSSVFHYQVSYGFYVQGNPGDLRCLMETIKEGKATLVTASLTDSFAMALKRDIQARFGEGEYMKCKASLLPTPEACVQSVINGEYTLYIGPEMPVYDENIKFIKIGRIHKSLIVSQNIIGSDDVKRSVEKLKEVIGRSASS
ncbi:MAG: molybdopterin-binding protein [Thermoplasmataceae archaeon]